MRQAYQNQPTGIRYESGTSCPLKDPHRLQL